MNYGLICSLHIFLAFCEVGKIIFKGKCWKKLKKSWVENGPRPTWKAQPIRQKFITLSTSFLRLKHQTLIPLRLHLPPFTAHTLTHIHQNGSCQNQNREKILTPSNRTLLLKNDPWFPHKQKDPRRSCTDPIKASSQQDRWVFNPSDEAYSKGTSSWNLVEATRGRAWEEDGFRSWCFCYQDWPYWGW